MKKNDYLKLKTHISPLGCCDVNLSTILHTHSAEFYTLADGGYFITAWLIGFYSGNFLSYDVDGSFKGNVITLHKNIATTIIFLVCDSDFWRYTILLQLPDTMSPTMKILAHVGHFLLSHATCTTNYRLFI